MKNRITFQLTKAILPFSFLLYTASIHAEIVKDDMEKEAVKIEQQSKVKQTVKGVVLDGKTQEAIIGASVKVEGQNTGTVTNLDGEFTISCGVGDILAISFIGYETQTVKVTNVKMYSVELNESTAQLGEVVVTAFGAGQKKESMVGSVEQIKPAELKVPSSSLSSSFAGRMAGVIAVQRSGEPGADGANFWIRGKSTFGSGTGALIVLDGVEISSSELNALDPEVIESFSILKDATATALYGTRGANGVMIVTTKSGKDLDKPIINFRLEGAVSQMTRVPEMADGPTYINMFNESLGRGDTDAKPYDVDSYMKYYKTNPYVYPNVNWYDEMFKNTSFSQRANFNIRGGSKRVDYFMSVGVKHSDGNLRPISKNFFSYNNNINVINYDFVNNLNIKATSTTKISLGMNLSIKDWKGPNSNVNDLFGLSKISNPVDFPVYFPAGTPNGRNNTDYVLWGDKYGGPYTTGYRNPVAEYVTGYKTSMNTIVTANFKLEQDLKMLLDGLKFSGIFSFKNNMTSEVKRTSAYNAFSVDNFNSETGEYDIKSTNTTEVATNVNTSGSQGSNRKIYVQAMLDYNHIFNDVHDLNVMLLYNHQQYNNNIVTNLYTSLPERKQGIAGRISYAYAGKYLAEANFGYNGSENFAKGHRFGFFPSFAIGYNIAEEAFWEKIKPVISRLKLRASWGLVGNDQTGAGRFSYMEDLALGSDPSFTTGFGSNVVTRKGPLLKRAFNPDLTWEIGEKYNAGIDLQLFDAVNISADVFKEVRRDIYMENTTMPGYLGMGDTKLYGNLGKVKNTGVDMSLDYNKQINKDLFVSFKGTFTYAHNTVVEYNEPAFRNYPNRSRTGHSIDQYEGFISNGLFSDWQAVYDWADQSGLGYNFYGPGDIRYVDQPDVNGNYSGTITSDDKVYLGNPQKPEIIYGFGPSIKWKNWDFSFFFQGAAKTSLMMSGIHPFGTRSINGLFQFIADDHWSVDNPNPNAKYPRLSKKDNTNNTEWSDYWLRNAAFLKLKNAEIGYTFKNMRFYFSGQNLLTFSPFKEWDPEMGGGSGLKYPTQRVFNVGFQITFNKK